MCALANHQRKESREQQPRKHRVPWASGWSRRWRWRARAGMIRNALLAACALVLTLFPVPASATFHLMKIVEIFPGTDSQPTAQYVMLQTYASDENHVQGHSVSVFAANGQRMGTFTFDSDVANGADRATILIATPEAESLFGIAADLEMTLPGGTAPTPGPQPPGPYGIAAVSASAASVLMQPAGGAVCWDVIDCVAWGSFDAPNALPMIEGPVIAPTGLTLGMAMHRDFTDNAGDTTDFTLASPAPKNNAGQIGAIGETPAPEPSPSPTGPPSDAGSAPGPVAPLTTASGMGSGGGGGGGCAVEPLAAGRWNGALLLVPALLVYRRGKRSSSPTSKSR